MSVGEKIWDKAPEFTEHHKDAVLAVVKHYMKGELRRKLITECPVAYNAFTGHKFFQVCRVSDGSLIDDEEVSA